MSFKDFMSIVGGGSGIFALIAMAGYWLFQTSLKAKLDISKQREIDNFKHSVELQMEKYKHQLELDQKRLSLVYENQRTSFKAVITAMRNVNAAILECCQNENNTNDDNFIFKGIDWKHIAVFQDAVQPESLLLPADCDWAVSKFAGLVSQLLDEGPSQRPKTATLLFRTLCSMEFMASQLKECFRKELGLPVSGDPLRDLHVFMAVSVLNEPHTESLVTISKILRWDEIQSPAEITSIAVNNIEVLRQTLAALKLTLEKHKLLETTFYERKLEVERYLDRLKNESSVISTGK